MLQTTICSKGVTVVATTGLNLRNFIYVQNYSDTNKKYELSKLKTHVVVGSFNLEGNFIYVVFNEEDSSYYLCDPYYHCRIQHKWNKNSQNPDPINKPFKKFKDAVKGYIDLYVDSDKKISMLYGIQLIFKSGKINTINSYALCINTWESLLSHQF